jgi:hypothetical protein
MRSVARLVLAASIAGLARDASASTIIFRTDAELIAQSERVVHARVVAQRTTWGPPPGRRIYTVTTLQVIEDFTGRDGDTIDVWELGGVIGSEVLHVGGRVELRVGQEVLVCLERGPRGLRSVAMGFSTFDVIRTSAGAALKRNVRDTFVVGGTPPLRERSLAEFRQLAAEVIGRPSRQTAAPVGETVIGQPFTKIAGEPGWRWRDADMGVPVNFYKNTNAPPPLHSGDGVPEIQTALAAWTNPGSASIIVQYAGTTLESDVDGGWTTIPARSALITFEDPEDEIAGAVLALGGGSASIGTGGSVGGVTYDGMDSGFVIFENAALMPMSFRESPDFTRVLTHEIGHAIGFGHTQTDGTVPNATANIMYPSCCFADSPAPGSLGADDLAGLNTVYPMPARSGPTMTLDKTSLRFAGVPSGSTFTWKTATQIVRLNQSGSGTVTWTATPTRPWVQVSPSSGTGSANLSVSVTGTGGLPGTGTADAAISFAFTGAANSPGPLAVRISLLTDGSVSPPIGTIETPADNATGVTGAIPVTGWALDDIEVTGVSICRGAVPGENASGDARCAGAPNQVFLGTGLFIDGARPDVRAAFPTYPLNDRAGWGFMVLTNMLPGQGNGTFELVAYAADREGQTVLLGRHTIACDNAHATKPFGTIDTPVQGGTASGASYVNFGWALTPQPKTIPRDGSTISILIDGVSIGRPTYDNFRQDIADAFPGLNNSNGAIGFRVIDTRTLTNGLHTIAWTVTDDHGTTEGIGSRYFTVSNTGSSGSMTTAGVATASSAAAVTALPIDRSPILARRGWDSTTAWRSFGSGTSDRVVIRGEEVDRLDLWLGDEWGQRYAGYHRVAGELTPLPIGSHLHATSGRFTWAPGAGFVGAYDLVFVRYSGQQPVVRREVRVILAAKGSGHVGTQVEIDLPRANQQVQQPFVLAGWAADLDAVTGTGIDTLHVWAYPLAGGPPVFLGTPNLGGIRPDVAAVHGDRLRESGFALMIQSLPPGAYTLAVFAWSNVTGRFAPPKSVRLIVR